MNGEIEDRLFESDEDFANIVDIQPLRIIKNDAPVENISSVEDVIDAYIVEEIWETPAPNIQIMKGVNKEDKKSYILVKEKNQNRGDTYREQRQFAFMYNLFNCGTNNESIPVPVKLICDDNHHSLVILQSPPQSIPLHKVIPQNGLALDTFFTFAIHLCEAIDWIHQKNVMHCNIQPMNILYDPETKRVLIFNFSRSMRWSIEAAVCSGSAFLDIESRIEYVSPEQTGRTDALVDHRTDLYSLGITLYQTLTGEVPFTSSSKMEILHMHLAKNPPSILSKRPEAPPILDRIIQKLLKKSCSDRYQSAHGVLYDLRLCQKRIQEDPNNLNFELELGTHDSSSIFRIPTKVYGRKKELRALEEILNRVHNNNNSELVILEGTAGMGKSALVRGLQPKAQMLGYFSSGKFEKHSVRPYAAVLDCFKNLLHQVLSDTDEVVNEVREVMCEHLQNDGRVLIEVLPELEMLIGSDWPEPESLPVNEAQRRLLRCIKVFTYSISKVKTLTLFFDDAQWADPGSKEVMGIVSSNRPFAAPPPMMTAKGRRTLIIFAHRSNISIQLSPAIFESNFRVNNIHVGALDLQAIRHLIADTVRLPSSSPEVTELATIVQRKTFGIPFFIVQFLSSLYRERLIEFNWTTRRFEWKPAEVESKGTGPMDPEFLADKLVVVPEPTLELVKAAACIGSTFSTELIEEIMPARVNVIHSLNVAVREGLITTMDSTGGDCPDPVNRPCDTLIFWRFYHDRIQAAVYSLMEPEERMHMHGRIGAKLLEWLQDDRAQLYDVVQQLNKAIPLGEGVTQYASQERLRELNLLAGRRAFQVDVEVVNAIDYLRTAESLLPDNPWDPNVREESLEIKRLIAECEFVVGNHTHALDLTQELLKHAEDIVARAELYILRVLIYSTTDRTLEAAHCFNEAMSDFGEDPIPLFPTLEIVFPMITMIIMKLDGIGLENIANLPRMTDRRTLALMKLFEVCSDMSYTHDPLFFAVVNCKAILLSLTAGEINESIISPLVCLSICCLRYGLLHNNANAYRIGEYAVESLIPALEPSNKIRAKAMSFFYSAMGIMRYSQTEIYAKLQEAFELSLRSGDPSTCGLCGIILCQQKFCMRISLEEVLDEVKKCVSLLEHQHGVLPHAFLYCTLRQSVRGLMGETMKNGSADFDGREFQKSCNLSQITETSVPLTRLVTYYAYKLVTLTTLGHYEVAIAVGREYGKLHSATGSYLAMRVLIMHALALSGVLRKKLSQGLQDSSEYHSLLTELKNLFALLQPLIEKEASHFIDNAILVEAEIASLEGNSDLALQLYSRATDLSRRQQVLIYKALALERTALHHYTHDQMAFASSFMNSALQLYVEWGAKNKISQVVEAYPNLVYPSMHMLPATFPTNSIENASSRTPNDLRSSSSHEERRHLLYRPNREAALSHTSSTHFETAGSTDEVDFFSVIRAVQVMSEMTELDSVIPAMLQIAAENAGATLCKMIFKQNSRLFLKSEWSASGGYTLRNDENTSDFPRSIASLVVRTFLPFRSANAYKEPNISRDPYIISNRVKSVICMPIFHNNEIYGCLYLENSSNSGAFTIRHIEVLEILCNQVAISILNARLVVSLQEATVAKSEMLKREQVARAEAERKEQKYRALLELMPQLVFTASPDGKFTFANAQWETYAGVKPEEILDWNWIPLFHPDDHKSLLEYWKEPSLAYNIMTTELRIKRKDGIYRWHIYRVMPIFDSADESVVHWIGTCTDVEDQKKAREDKEIYGRLIKSESRFRRLFESNLAGIFFANRNGSIYEANETYFKLTGLKREELINNYPVLWQNHTIPEHRELDIHAIKEMERSGECNPYEKCCLMPNGKKVWVQAGLARIPNSEEGSLHNVMGFVMDITDRKNMVEELIRTREAALESMRMKSQFLANMSHELRTPFSGVLGMVNLLADTILDPIQREYVDTCQQSCHMLLRIIDSLLDYSKLEAKKVKLEYTAFSTVSLLGDVCHLLSSLAHDKDVELNCFVDALLPRVLIGDVGRLRQILMNLVGNGIKFTHNGEVFVRCIPMEKDSKHIVVKFEIQDTGIGMSHEEQLNLFRPFSQVDGSTTRMYGGTGLGLSICRELTQLMQGDIGVRSSKGKGSLFWFTVKLEIAENSNLEVPMIDLPPVRVMLLAESQNKVAMYQAKLFPLTLDVPESTQKLLETLRAASDEALPHILILDYNVFEEMHRLVEELVKEPRFYRIRLLFMSRSYTMKRKRCRQLEDFRAIERLIGNRMTATRIKRPPMEFKLRQLILDLMASRVRTLTEGLEVLNFHPKSPEKEKERHEAMAAVYMTSQLATLSHIDHPTSGYDRKALPSSANTENAGTFRLEESMSKSEKLAHITNITVLVAEDNPIAQKVVVRQLHKYGFEKILLANDGEEAVKMFQRSASDISVILMDCHMPHLDGFEAARAIRKWEYSNARMRHVPIIALTADVQSSTKQTCLEAGMQDCLHKPVNQTKILEVIRRWGQNPDVDTLPPTPEDKSY
ncbi:uncharacterized protein VTP21DRAFT_289 [Calcarisporiella thermophila]|uniref:uncharacterized protein n=1 Tax=Calcarisporiella thermophila TaxID=911321 RepID=UPI0037420633